MSSKDSGRVKRGIIGTVASSIASILIAIVLIIVYYDGIEAAFKPPGLYLLVALIIVGLVALYGYLGFSKVSYWHMKNISPIALVLGSLAIAVGYFRPVEGGALIFLAYVVEFFVGSKLYIDYKEVHPTGALLFVMGVTIFIVSLPIIILNQSVALVALVGDIIKLAGLLMVLGRLGWAGGAGTEEV
ncbi:MAG: hypothetical protein F7C35_00535 [Desulfurococcales archaeon]|nr:hypothetical protein [Desulfurococcales archaeon]